MKKFCYNLEKNLNEVRTIHKIVKVKEGLDMGNQKKNNPVILTIFWIFIIGFLLLTIICLANGLSTKSLKFDVNFLLNPTNIFFIVIMVLVIIMIITQQAIPLKLKRIYIEGDVLNLDKSTKIEKIEINKIKYVYLTYNTVIAYRSYKILIIQELNGKAHRVLVDDWSYDDLKTMLSYFVDNQQVQNLSSGRYIDVSVDNYNDEDDDEIDNYEKIGLIVSGVIMAIVFIVIIVVSISNSMRRSINEHIRYNSKKT